MSFQAGHRARTSPNVSILLAACLGGCSASRTSSAGGPDVAVADTYGEQAWNVMRQANPDTRFLRVRFRREGIPDGVAVLLGTLTLSCGVLTYEQDGQRFREAAVALFDRFGVNGVIYGPSRFCASPPPAEGQPTDAAAAPVTPEIDAVDALGQRAADAVIGRLGASEVVTRLAFEPASEWQRMPGDAVPMSCGFVTTRSAGGLLSVERVAVLFETSPLDGSTTASPRWGWFAHALCSTDSGSFP